MKSFFSQTIVFSTLVLMPVMLSVPLASSAAEPSEEPTETKTYTLLALGDSLTAGYGISSNQAWPALLETKATDEGYAVKVVNAGMSGDSTAGGLRRLPWLLKRKVDGVIIALGANDGLRGLDLEDSRANLAKIIEAIKAQNSEVDIWLAGMQIPPNFGAEYTKQFKEIFPKLAKEKRVKLIPFLLDGVAGHPHLNQIDRMHPNAEGHKIILKTIWEHIHPALPSGF